MAEYLKLGSTEIYQGPYDVMGLMFPPPALDTESRDYADKDGSEIISIRYRNSVRTVVIKITGSTKDNLYTLISGIQTELNSADLVLEYKSVNATNSSYSDVLTHSSKTKLDILYLRDNKAQLTMTLECKPGWRGTQQTIAAQTLSPTPAKITLGTILGDMKTPCTIEIEGDDSFGTNIRIGSRELPMPEGPFTPIKDFQGTVLAGAFNGEVTEKTVTDSWTSLTGESRNVNAVSMVSAAVGFAACDGGYILKTGDGWSTVTEYDDGDTGTSQDLLSISAYDANTAFAGTAAGKAVKTVDGGTNWTLQTIEASKKVYSLFFINATVGWAGMSNGKVYYTTNGGTNWTGVITSGFSAYGVHFIDANNGWSVHDGGYVYKTDDGGVTWSFAARLLPTGSTSYDYIYAVHFASSLIGWCGGAVGNGDGSGALWKTEDGGSNWTQQADTGSIVLDIAATSTTNAWQVGQNGIITKTTNGTDWAPQASGVATHLNSISVIDANNVNIVGDGYTVLDTDDGGTIWTQPIAAWALTMGYKGRYHAYCRIKKSASGAGDMRVSSGWAGGSVITNPSVSVTAATDWQTVYLGEISIPATNLSPEVSATPIIKVEGKLDAGSETWKPDATWLVPADGEAVEIAATATDSAHMMIDSDQNAVNQGPTIVTWIGSPIFLRPGDNNIVICETAGIGDCIVTVRYFPLYKLPVA